jgi:hypothetical protein
VRWEHIRSYELGGRKQELLRLKVRRRAWWPQEVRLVFPVALKEAVRQALQQHRGP